MQRRIKFILLFVLISLSANSQEGKVREERDHYVAPVGLDTVFVVNYYIRNDTKSDLVFWIDLDTTHTSDKTKRYFYKVNGDFSIVSLLNDDNVINKRFDIVGTDFIKIIKSSEVFTVSVSFKSKSVWASADMRKYLFFKGVRKLSSSLQNSLIENRDFLFKSNAICLDYSQILGK